MVRHARGRREEHKSDKQLKVNIKQLINFAQINFVTLSPVPELKPVRNFTTPVLTQALPSVHPLPSLPSSSHPPAFLSPAPSPRSGAPLPSFPHPTTTLKKNSPRPPYLKSIHLPHNIRQSVCQRSQPRRTFDSKSAPRTHKPCSRSHPLLHGYSDTYTSTANTINT